MKLFICVASPDERLRRYVGKAKEGAVPREVVTRGPFMNMQPRLTVLAWMPKLPFSARDLERFLLQRARDHDAVLLLIDDAWRHHAAGIRNAAFIIPFGLDGSENPQNFIYGLLAKALRNFGQILAKFQKGDDSKLLALPLRNFKAEELSQIARLCREHALSGSLSNAVETQLAKLRARVRPRRRSLYKATYAVDDESRFFSYGLERHAQFETGHPHLPSCEVAGLFRFGARLDERRHYNVSETEGDRTTIAGEFADCHDTKHGLVGESHLNMFANDFF